MAREELTAREIKATILYKLARKGAWGEAYLPLDTIVRRLAKKIKKDGKRIKAIIDSLIKEEYLIPHKGGKTISLNTSRKGEILKAIEEIFHSD